MEIRNINGFTILKSLDIEDIIQYMINNDISLNYADLSNKEINDMTFKDIDLKYIDFSKTKFLNCTFINVTFNTATLSESIFRICDFINTNFIDNRFNSIALTNNQFYNCNIDADLSNSHLIYNDYYKCNLMSSKFPENISNNFYDCKLKYCKTPPYTPLACPSNGAFIGWKIVGDCLIQLLIPSDAKRSSASGTKCRCNKAKVISIFNLQTKQLENEIVNLNYNSVTYKTGHIVFPDMFDNNRYEGCSNGIHFFINKQDALNYYTLYNC